MSGHQLNQAHTRRGRPLPTYLTVRYEINILSLRIRSILRVCNAKHDLFVAVFEREISYYKLNVVTRREFPVPPASTQFKPIPIVKRNDSYLIVAECTGGS